MERDESSSPRLLPPPLTVPGASATSVCTPQARRFVSYSTSTASGGNGSALCSPSEQLDASRCWPPVLMGTYTPECLMHFNELFSAGRITLFNVEQILMNGNAQFVTSTSYIKMMDGCTQKLIDFARGLSAFRSLASADQAVLLKASICEMHIFRSVLNYDLHTESFSPNSLADGFNISMDQLKVVNWPMYIMLHRFLDTFNPEWAADRIIVLLLMCIALFNPSCVGIGDAPLVACANTTYTALLHIYLQETIPTESQSKYVLNALRAKLDEAHQINHTTLSFIRSLNANDVGPLVYAFFDLG